MKLKLPDLRKNKNQAEVGSSREIKRDPILTEKKPRLIKGHSRSQSHDNLNASHNQIDLSHNRIDISDVLGESPLLNRGLMSNYIDIERDVLLKEKMIEFGQDPKSMDKSSMRKLIIKNLLKYQDMGSLAGQLANEKILLSNLSVTQYRGLINNISHTALHLPADFSYSADAKPKEAFLSFEDIGRKLKI